MKKQNNRVLTRLGARELTLDEVQQVAGAYITNNCTLATRTATGDGDGCKDFDVS